MSDTATKYISVQVATRLPVAANPLALALYGSTPEGEVEQAPASQILAGATALAGETGAAAGAEAGALSGAEAGAQAGAEAGAAAGAPAGTTAGTTAGAAAGAAAAEGFADAAELAALNALSAASLVGSFKTKALADAALGNFSEGQTVDVTEDADPSLIGAWAKRGGIWEKISDATLGSVALRLAAIPISTSIGLPRALVIQDEFGGVVGAIDPDGVLIWRSIRAALTGTFAGAAELTEVAIDSSRQTVEAVPGFALSWLDEAGAVAGGIEDDGRLRAGRARIDELEVGSLIVPGLDTGETYPGLVDGTADRYGFMARLVRTDGVIQQRANPLTSNRQDPPNFAPNAVALLAPAGDRLEGWWHPTADLEQAVVNLSVWGDNATLVGAPEGSTQRLILGVGRYLDLPRAETSAMTVPFVAALAGTSRGVILSSRIVDLTASDRVTPWGLELALEPTTGGAADLVARISYANRTSLQVEDIELRLAVATPAIRRLYVLTVDATSMRLEDVTGGTTASAALPGEHYAGRKNLRLGADRGGVASGSVSISALGLYRVALTSEERAAVVAFVRAYSAYILGVTL